MLGSMRSTAGAILPAKTVVAEPSPERFPLLDAIRALAAFSIFAYHVSVRVEATGWAQDLTSSLAIGVPVFFVVSGFLLYRPFALSHLRGEPAPRTAPYAWRRLLRIAPAFWVALTVFVVFGGESEPLRDLPALYGFAQVYDPALLHDGIGQAWSLDCEVVYYAMIPLIALAARAMAKDTGGSRLRWEAIGLVALLTLSEGYKLWFHTFGDLKSPRDNSFIFHPGWNLDLFVLGMALALWSAYRQIDGRGLKPLTSHPQLCWLGAVVLYLTAVALGDRYDDAGGHELIHAINGGAAVLAVLPAIVATADGSPVRRMLANRYLLGAGVISYGFYLYHQMFLAKIFTFQSGREQELLTDVGLVVIAFVGAIGASVVSWIVIERPALSLRRLVPQTGPGPDVSAGLESGSAAPAGAAK